MGFLEGVYVWKKPDVWMDGWMDRGTTQKRRKFAAGVTAFV
jgi:hypothetical protein